jgi:type VI secretion system Hcp family effector
VSGPQDQEGRTQSGTTRRDVLRGGAVGVGALVGAMALVNANEVTSEAEQRSSVRKMTVGFSLFNVNHAVVLHSLDFGGEVNGSPEPTLVTLTLDTNKYSPLLLKAYAEATTLAKVKINEYETNVQGVEELTTTITFTNSRIVSFHTDVATSDFSPSAPHVRDTLKLTFGSATIERLDGLTTYTWTLPT